MKSLLEKTYTEEFKSTSFNSFDMDTIKNSSCMFENMEIIICGWMVPHTDEEYGHGENWTFKPVILNDTSDDEKICFVYTLSNGKVVGNILEIGKLYTFNYTLKHALIPYSLAIKAIEYQTFDFDELNIWIKEREHKDYTETAKMAFGFLDVEVDNIYL
tara:strand:- start:437 stop:913 length:477 start_codon:yes stop_codon:yes gene_type:complete